MSTRTRVPRVAPGGADRPRRTRRGRRVLARETGRLAKLAGPIVVSQLGQVGMNTADTIMVGPLGANPLAAVGLGSALHFLGIVFSVGVLVGLAPIVSQAFGAGDLGRCRRAMVQGLWVALLLSVPVGVFNLLGEPIALALGQEAQVSALAGGYLAALAWGVPGYFLFVALKQTLEAMNRPVAPMVVTFFGLGLNIIANRVLIYGIDGIVPAMGVVGTGWATTIVRWSMLLVLAGWVWRNAELRPFHHGVRASPDRRIIGEILIVGTPIGGQVSLEAGCFSFAAIMMGWLGPIELAAHQVTINIAATTFMVALGTSIAGSVRVGQHIGARRPGAVRRAALATYILAVGFMAICALLFVALPHELIGLYTRDTELIDLGARLLIVAAAFQVFDGAQVAGMSVLRGAADTRTPMLLAAIGYWGLGVAVGYLLAFAGGLGAVGVWIGLSTGLATVALMLGVRVRRTIWLTPIRALHAGPPMA